MILLLRLDMYVTNSHIHFATLMLRYEFRKLANISYLMRRLFIFLAKTAPP